MFDFIFRHSVNVMILLQIYNTRVRSNTMYVHTLQDHVYIMCVSNGIDYLYETIRMSSIDHCLYVSQSCRIVACNVYIIYYMLSKL